MDCLILNVGDKIFYDNALYPIVKLEPTGVYINKGRTMHYVFCSDLAERKFEYCVEFSKNGYKGESHATTEQGALREQSVLQEIGWETNVYKREVR